MNIQESAAIIKASAQRAGFSDCGIAQARNLSNAHEKLVSWISDGLHAGMSYLERNTEQRCNPQLLMPGARSIIVVLLAYHHPAKGRSGFLISEYAGGRDYHAVMKDRMSKMVEELKTSFPGAFFKASADTGPVMEKAWAQQAGLGWQGKHSVFIHPVYGSKVFIGTLITDVEAEPGTPEYDGCALCNRCMKACPTNAIPHAFVVDARRCIAWQTIENKGEIPEHISASNPGWIYGCDACQDVCPYNRDIPLGDKELAGNYKIRSMTDSEWENLSEEEFMAMCSGTVLMRAGYQRLMRNIKSIGICSSGAE